MPPSTDRSRGWGRRRAGCRARGRRSAGGGMQPGHLGEDVLVGDPVGIVGDLQRCHLRDELDDAGDVRLSRMRRAEGMDEEIELEAHLVAQLDLDIAIAGGEEFGKAVDHVAPAPRPCCQGGLPPAKTERAISVGSLRLNAGAIAYENRSSGTLCGGSRRRRCDAGFLTLKGGGEEGVGAISRVGRIGLGDQRL